ncbi:MAG: hypothetical protein O2897_01970, partial [bacterium]|nr:hypothetical protein [bacterium]
SERLTALNDVKVDATLNNFMRKVCAALLRLCDQEKTSETQSYINNIENPDVYGGAIEINAFLNFFALSAHEIAIIHDIEGEKLQHHVYNKTSKQEQKLPAAIMFASSNLHYDVLVRK